jgi:lipoprotein-anchoring transpeptidase ErfK/SrfK/heme/copper-type cytochrome/quinol oxidase subunit 2
MSRAFHAAQKAEVFFREKKAEKQNSKKKHQNRKIGIFWFIAIPIFCVLLAIVILGYPKVFALNASQEKSSNLGLEENIVINFNLPINPDNLLEKISFDPEEEGTIKLTNNNKTLIFSPKQPFLSNTTYKIKISDVKSVFQTKLEEKTLTFQTKSVPLPKITQISFNESEEFYTPLDTEIKITFDKNDPSFEFRFQSDPEFPYVISRTQNLVTLKPAENLKSHTIYTLEAFSRFKTPDNRAGNWIKNDFSHTFNTYPRLKITEFYPYDQSINVPLRQSIYIHLNRNVEEFDFTNIAETLTFSPPIKGEVIWENQSTLLFNPLEDLQSDTDYSVSIQYDYDKTFNSTFKTQKIEKKSNIPEAPQPKITTGHFIDINLSTQSLYAFQDGSLVFSTLISGGLYYTPSPQGDFQILEKVENKRYVGTNRDGSRYDLPNTKFNLRFHGPYWIHSAYWHNNFGNPMSHGCINLPLESAEWIYHWAEIGDPVFIHS